MLSNRLSIREMPMPTYLQDIFRSRTIVNLIHQKLYKTESGYTEIPPDVDRSLVEGELIGNPLVVDLGEHVDFKSSESASVRDNWTKDEACFGPVDYEDSKQYLNNGKKVKLTQFCLLNGANPRKYLCTFQGSDKPVLFHRGSINYIGYFSTSDDEVTFDALLKNHNRYCEPNSEILCAVHTLYPLVGVNKRCSEDVSYKNVAKSAFIEVLSTEKQFVHTKNKSKLFLQINAADQKSALHPLWQELTLLKKFIDYLNDDDDLNSIVISDNPKSFVTVSDEIVELLRSYAPKQYSDQVVINWKELNVNQMRSYDFLENLYLNLLKLEDLRQVLESFHALFNDLTDEPLDKMHGLNNSTLSVIINGLINGTMAVPTLTLSSSLRFLIELGMDKLHNDYLCLINILDSKAETRFREKWDKISQTNTQVATANTRKSRVSIAQGNGNTGQLIKQLNHLALMHVTTEFMHLAIECNLVGEDTFRHTFDQLYDNKRIEKSFKTLQISPVVDFDCQLFSDQYALIKAIIPVSINVNFSTKTPNRTSITTIFHFSSTPIFPPCIFKEFEAEDHEIEKKKYYVHKAHIFEH